MNLHQLTDENLDQATIKLVRSERELLIEILNHLREVERRRLFSEYGFGSLFDYAIKRLGYSEDQAARRISAMRLLKELPSIEDKVESGALTLTHLAKAQAFFRQEKKAQMSRSAEGKMELLAKIENTSKRQTENLIEVEQKKNDVQSQFESFLSRGINSAEFKSVDFGFGPSQLKITLEQFSPELQKKLTRLLEVRSHTNDEMNLEKLLNEIADLALEKWDPLKKAMRLKNKSERNSGKQVEEKVCKNNSSSSTNNAAVPAPVKVKSSNNPVNRRNLPDRNRYIPSTYRHAVWLRDEGKCQKCGSKMRVEVDHIKPFASGGRTQLSNLRLLCRNCNQRHAIESYGMQKMSLYLKTPLAAYFE